MPTATLSLRPQHVARSHELRDGAPGRRRAHGRRDHRRGPELRRRAQRPHGREHRQRRPAGAGRLPLAGRAVAGASSRGHADRPGRRGRLPARPRRGAQRPDAPTRCSRRTGSAPGWRGARCPRPRCAAGSTRDTLARLRRAGVRLHRRAVRRQRRRAHRRARDHRPGATTTARTDGGAACSTASPTRPSRPRPSVPTGRRRQTLTAVIVPEAQVRAVPGRGARPRPCRPPSRRRGDGAAAGAGRRTAAARPALLRDPRRARRPWPGRPGPGWRCARRTTGRRRVARPGPGAATPRSTSPSWCSAPTRARCRPARPGAGPAGRAGRRRAPRS